MIIFCNGSVGLDCYYCDLFVMQSNVMLKPNRMALIQKSLFLFSPLLVLSAVTFQYAFGLYHDATTFTALTTRCMLSLPSPKIAFVKHIDGI